MIGLMLEGQGLGSKFKQRHKQQSFLRLCNAVQYRCINHF
jgi:hypothetical protein